MKKLPPMLEIRPNHLLSHSEAIIYRADLINLERHTRGLPAFFNRFLEVNSTEIKVELNLLNRFLGNTQRIKTKKVPLENGEWNIKEKVGFCSACFGLATGICTSCTEPEPKEGTRAYYEAKMPKVQFKVETELRNKRLLAKLQRRLAQDRQSIMERGVLESTSSLLPDDLLREHFLEYKNIMCKRTISLPEDRGELWVETSQELTDFDISMVIPQNWQSSEEVMQVCHQIVKLHELPFLLGPLPGHTNLAAIGVDLFNTFNHW